MAVSVAEEAGGTILTDGTEQTIGAAITAGGAFFLELDLTPLVGGSTPDIVRIREKKKVRSGATLRTIKTYDYTGGLAPQWEQYPQRAIAANEDLTYTIERIQGTDRTYTYSIKEIG